MRAGEEVDDVHNGQRRSKRKYLEVIGRKVGSKVKHIICEHVICDNPKTLALWLRGGQNALPRHVSLMNELRRGHGGSVFRLFALDDTSEHDV